MDAGTVSSCSILLVTLEKGDDLVIQNRPTGTPKPRKSEHPSGEESGRDLGGNGGKNIARGGQES